MIRSTTPVRVVVVEDSLVQRAHIVTTLEADDDITVVGEAVGAEEAIAVVAREQPDVVTLDLEIPDGGGQYAIEQIMGNTPTPILVLSATVESRTSASAIEALVAGAMDAFPKPRRWTSQEEVALRRAVRGLRGIAVVRHPRGRLAGLAALAPNPRRMVNTSVDHRSPVPSGAVGSEPDGLVVAIAASTGGPQALGVVLGGLGELHAPVLVVQHMHPDFVDGLVTWIGTVSALPTVLATAGDQLRPGTVYIAPGGAHLRLGADRRIVLAPEPVTTHRPSADELFRSVATHAGANAIGVVLTGMGDDGAAGLLDLRQAGALTIAQDEASCSVFGMPRAAGLSGAVMRVLPLGRIAEAVLNQADRSPR
ncbi:MAG: chemotaxis-specific protein-glutamate methyltransferase CheB [Acidobacteria bacterium]|nr:chemotaxis-specific protein-glutamate methyltransferase CheB [Acidobacteriota bacterium]